MCMEVVINGDKPCVNLDQLICSIGHCTDSGDVRIIKDTHHPLIMDACLCQIDIPATLEANGATDIKTDFLVYSCRIGGKANVI